MTAYFENLILDFSKIQIKANSEGLIPAFNVLLVQLPTNFLNLFTSKLIQSILNSPNKTNNLLPINDSLCDYAAALFENAAAECGFHTGNGIIKSEEFEAILGSADEHLENVLYGLFAVAASWGWGDFEIVELIPYEKMVLRVYDYYEADVTKIYKPQKYFAHMITGISRAFMDIVYNNPMYELGGFKCIQTKGIELGDEYGEFVATRVRKDNEQ